MCSVHASVMAGGEHEELALAQAHGNGEAVAGAGGSGSMTSAPKIQAIQSRFDGFLFRSRLEARAADAAREARFEHQERAHG